MRPTIYRGKWCATWTENGLTKRRSLRIGGAPKDRALAERIIAESQQKPMGQTVEAIMDAYLAERDHTATAAGRLRDAWKALKGTFAPLLPEQINAGLCRSYAAQRREEGRQNGTIRKELSTLRTALRWAKTAPASFELPRPPPPKDRYLTRKEYDQLLAAAQDPHIQVFILLAISTAARAGALLDLKWSQVDEKRGIISLASVEDKTRKGRATVPMGARAREAVEIARAMGTKTHLIEYGGEKVESIKTGFRTAVERAGLQDVTPHVLRHTAAVWMAEAGVPMPEIAQYLGHSDSRVTERVYAKYSPEYLRKAAKALD